ncbi:MAG: rhamnogalacturonan lyase [Prevotella sp.]|nr:rhamnogalacturonan lyase [Prevotella sp.]
MKKIYSTLLLFVTTLLGAQAQNTPVSQMEKLDRGVVAVPVSNGSTSRLISWRLLGTDPRSTRFDVLRDGTVIANDLKTSNFLDKGGKASSTYQVRVKVDGEVVETTTPVTPWANVWMKLPLDRPAAGAANSGTYTPNDCSVGDVDGDGEYEIFVKWDPSTSQDNSNGGITDNVYIDCYKLDGTKLWRIDLGRNIRAGAHYTQFQVYDYDGDGKAEMICKTAPGSLDGTGVYVNQATDNATIKAADNTKDWAAAGGGRINGGHEYLTVFDGLTGKAINTIAYYPNRNGIATLSAASGTKDWDTRSDKSDTGSYGNRGERYLAGTAYIDGPDNNASAIFCRGYYTYAYIWAVSFDGEKLIPRWLSSHESGTAYNVVTWDAEGNATSKSYSGCSPTSGSGSGTMFQNGNHNMSVADVDGDGKDDIIWGSAALKHDGTLRYGTGFGHGDAIHVGAMIPGREGLQVFDVHEEKGTYAWDLHDAATGEIIYKDGPAGVDNGRGMAAQLSATDNAWWFSSASVRPQYSAATGKQASDATSSVNFRMYWDGTVQEALLDGNTLDKYNDSSKSFGRLVTFYNLGPGSTCNGSKNTPNLSADIFGDWREELVLYSVSDDETYLGIYSTNIETKYYVPTLMHDHTYRMGICWQNTAYNQPPHLGYNLAVATLPHLESDMYTEAKQNEDMAYDIQGAYISALKITKVFRPSGTSTTILAKAGFATTMDEANETLKLTGIPEEAGEYRFVVRLTDMNGVNTYDTLHVKVMEATGIEQARQANNVVKTTICDVFGRVLPAKELGQLPRGIYLVREESANGAVETRKVMKE